MTYEEMVPRMLDMHRKSIRSLEKVDRLFYVDHMDTYKRDRTLTGAEAAAMEDRLDNKYLKSELKVYGVT